MVSRREFLKIGLAGVAGLAVGGVAGNLIRDFTARAREAELKDRIEDLERQLGMAPLEDEVRVYNWSWYINPYLNTLFRKMTGVPVIYDTFETTEECWAKIEPGGSGYDVAVPSDFDVAELYRLGKLEDINLDLLPNTDYLFEDFKNPAWDPEHKYQMPYMWGTTGIGWNTTKIAPEDLVEDPDTGEMGIHLEQLFDLEPGGFVEKYGKKTTMIGSEETLNYVMKYLGWRYRQLADNRYGDWGLNSVDNPAAVNAAVALMKTQKPFLLTYADASGYIPNLASERYWISWAWSGDVYVVISENPNVKYNIPKEGTDIWCDSMCIPKDAPHPNAAHAWMNFMTNPLVAALNSLYTWYANPVEGSLELLPDSFKNDPMIYPPREWWGNTNDAKLQWWRAFNAEERQRMTEAWAEVAAA